LPSRAATFATVFFGEAYDRTAGVVRVPGASTLRPELTDHAETVERDKHGRFFLEVNPGFARGDELVCCARLDLDNLTRVAHRMLEA